MKYRVTKTFGNELGLSCCFRQWRSTHSHCSLLHGYSVGARVILEAETLDDRNWVYDFGAFKEFKDWLKATFDHTVLVAKDDPHISFFREMNAICNPNKRKEVELVQHTTEEVKFLSEGLINLVEVENIGCEAFSKLAYDKMVDIVSRYHFNKVKVVSVEIFEHGANSASYIGG